MYPGLVPYNMEESSGLRPVPVSLHIELVALGLLRFCHNVDVPTPVPGL